jgi:hypothetical protein
MDLNKEAEEYANKNVTKSLHAAYVEGATNSKYVQSEKIKFAIEQLYKFRESTFGKGINVIKELENQLKELK